MGGIQGVGGPQGPRPERPEGSAHPPAQQPETRNSGARDDVTISSEAQDAAQVARLAQMAREQDDIREDRVAAARANIAEGLHRREDVVLQTAERLARLLP